MNILQQFYANEFDYPTRTTFGIKSKTGKSACDIEDSVANALAIAAHSYSLLIENTADVNISETLSTYAEKLQHLNIVANRTLGQEGSRVSTRQMCNEYRLLRQLFYTIAFAVLPLARMTLDNKSTVADLGLSGRMKLKLTATEFGALYNIYYDEFIEQHIVYTCANPDKHPRILVEICRFGGMLS